jgi:RNA polymerase sigma-70 factor (ECF subfamily)
MESRSQSRQFVTAVDQNIKRQEFAVAVERHRPHIFRYLLASSRDVDTAETLTQECFLKACRHWSGFRGDSSVATWLMRIAINLQRDHWRSRRLQFWRQTQRNAVDLDDACNWLPSNIRSPEDQVLAREQVTQVWKAVERMTEKQRTVFLLRFVEDLQYSEIAQATDMREGTVKAHVSRALARIRQELGRSRRALTDSFAT